jgi:Na+/H+ antiporter NhaD/arsenite permease-like protein
MMIPLVEKLAIHLGDPSATKALWWAMAIGVNIGGNGTIIAASPNVVVSGIAEQSKHKITFGMYFKYGFLSVVMSAILGTIYVFIRYLI